MKKTITTAAILALPLLSLSGAGAASADDGSCATTWGDLGVTDAAYVDMGGVGYCQLSSATLTTDAAGTASFPGLDHWQATDGTVTATSTGTVGILSGAPNTTYDIVLYGPASPAGHRCAGMILSAIPQSTEPTTEPTVEPTTEPTVEPTTEPTVEPTTEPTVEPTTEPTVEPTTKPTVEPTTKPTVEPTTKPTVEPTTKPTRESDSETRGLPRTGVSGSAVGSVALFGVLGAALAALVAEWKRWVR